MTSFIRTATSLLMVVTLIFSMAFTGVAADNTDTKLLTNIKKHAYYDVPLHDYLQDYIFRLCDEHDLDPAIIIALIKRESNFIPTVIGDSGDSLGLMQIQPKWHYERMKKLGCPNLLNPYQNVTVGIDLIVDLIEMGGSLDWALMAYAAGPGYANRLTSEGIVCEKVLLLYENAKNLELR